MVPAGVGGNSPGKPLGSSSQANDNVRFYSRLRVGPLYRANHRAEASSLYVNRSGPNYHQMGSFSAAY